MTLHRGANRSASGHRLSQATGTFDAQNAERFVKDATPLPSRSPSHIVHLVRQHSRLLEFDLLAMADKECVKPSQIVALRALRAALEVLWTAVLPGDAARESLQAPCAPSVSVGSPRASRCRYGLCCWNASCPYSHPSPAQAFHAHAPSVSQGNDLHAHGQGTTRASIPTSPPLEQTAGVEQGSSQTFSLGSTPSVLAPHQAAHDEQEGRVGASCLSLPRAGGVQANTQDVNPGEGGGAEAAEATEFGHYDHDAVLAQAIALSLEAQEQCGRTRLVSTVSPEVERAWPVMPGRSETASISVQSHSAPAMSPLCGDCHPPASWQLRFRPGRCVRCHATVDVYFQPPGD